MSGRSKVVDHAKTSRRSPARKALTLWVDARRAIISCDEHLTLLDKKTIQEYEREGECTICLQRGGPLKFRILTNDTGETETVEPQDLVGRLYEKSRQGIKFVVVKA